MKTGKLGDLLDTDLFDTAVFHEAITHRSAGNRHNERLEFLGDSILSLVVTQYIYKALPQADEGDLSRLRAHLVNKHALAAIGRAYGLGDLLHLGPGELKSGGHRRDSILADAVEAIIGAVYLEKGLDYTDHFIRALYGDALSELPQLDELKDPKTRLQEYLQAKNLALPQYSVIEITGKPHNQRFKTVCEVSEVGLKVEGSGTSRRKAEQDAARKALETMTQQHA